MTSEKPLSGLAVRFAGSAFAALARASARRPTVLRFLMGGGDQVVYRASVSEPVVALTIDDAPSAATAPLILDVLNSFDSKATFFVIGSFVRGNEALLDRLVSEGHEIGHHMLTDVPSHKLPIEQFRQQFLQTDAILRMFTTQLRWFRPGSGRFTSAMLDVIREYGYKGVLGDVYPVDAHIPSVGFAYEVIVRATRPGSILILHDGLKRGLRTARILNRAIPALNLRGYRIVTLTELFNASS